MSRKEILLLLKAVRIEVEKTKKWFEKAHQSANEVATASANLPSQSGDRYHSRNQAELNRETFNNLVNLEKELLYSLNNEIFEIQIPCYIEILINADNVKKIYLVNNIANVNGFTIVSSSSPLGQKLINKKVGDLLDLTTGKGVIIKIS